MDMSCNLLGPSVRPAFLIQGKTDLVNMRSDTSKRIHFKLGVLIVTRDLHV